MGKGNITGKGFDQGAINTYLSNVKSMANNLKTATNAANALANDLKTETRRGVYTVAGLAHGKSSGKQVKIANAVNYSVAGVGYVKSKSSSGATYTSTGKSNMKITKTKFGAAQVELKTSGGVVTQYAGTASSAQAYTTAALAIAALPAVAASRVKIGYVSTKAAASSAAFGTTKLGKASSHTSTTYVNTMLGHGVTTSAGSSVTSTNLTLSSLSRA